LGGAQKEQGDIETEILGLLEEIDAAVAEDRKLQQEAEKLEKETSQRIKALEDAKKDAETALLAARSGRADFASGIGAEILEKYEFIRAQRGLAVAHIVEDKAGRISCGGCNMGLTAQKIVDLKTPDALVFCDNCQRIIYLAKTVYG
jgi:predicted  nucleic acid-binding Zn-ribbon protein